MVFPLGVEKFHTLVGQQTSVDTQSSKAYIKRSVWCLFVHKPNAVDSLGSARREQFCEGVMLLDVAAFKGPKLRTAFYKWVQEFTVHGRRFLKELQGEHLGFCLKQGYCLPALTTANVMCSHIDPKP